MKLRVSTAVVLHEDGGADLTVLFGHVLDKIGEHERLVPRPKDAIAVDPHFGHVAGGLTLQFPVDRRRQNFIVSVNVT